MNEEGKEGPPAIETQIVSEVLKTRVIPAVKEHLDYLKTSSPDEEIRRLCKFSEEDFRVRAEKLSKLVPLLESFAENPREFSVPDFHLDLKYPPLRGKWGGAKTILVLRRERDPEPPDDLSKPQTEVGFMALEDKVPEEEKEELRRGLEYKKGITPDRILEIQEEKFPGKRVIFFAAGISRPRGRVKVNYYAGVQFSCSSVVEHCFKPDGIVFTGSTPYQTPYPITERRMTPAEMKVVKRFLDGFARRGD